jgi:Phage integrase family
MAVSSGRSPPAVGRAFDSAIGTRASGPILLNSLGTRMDRHAATRRLRRLAEEAGVPITRPHPHMLRHTFVTTMLDAGVDLRGVQIAAGLADPRTTMRYDRARQNLDPPPQLHPCRLHGLWHLTRPQRPHPKPARSTALPNCGHWATHSYAPIWLIIRWRVCGRKQSDLPP